MLNVSFPSCAAAQRIESAWEESVIIVGPASYSIKQMEHQTATLHFGGNGQLNSLHTTRMEWQRYLELWRNNWSTELSKTSRSWWSRMLRMCCVRMSITFGTSFLLTKHWRTAFVLKKQYCISTSVRTMSVSISVKYSRVTSVVATSRQCCTLVYAIQCIDTFRLEQYLTAFVTMRRQSGLTCILCYCSWKNSTRQWICCISSQMDHLHSTVIKLISICCRHSLIRMACGVPPGTCLIVGMVKEHQTV